jgi:hypothetical protein
MMSITVIRRFNASLAGLKSLWGWTFAGKPLYATSNSWFRPELDCSSTIQPEQKNEDKKYDNSTSTKFD